MLGPDDVGHRVVVRRIVGVQADRPLFSDVIGRLVGLGESGRDESQHGESQHGESGRDESALIVSELIVETDNGTVRIPVADLVAAKRVPPPRVGTAALERLASQAWPAIEIEQLGGWQLRASGGWTGRANSALPLGNPGMSLPAAIDTIIHWYAERALPARINVPLPLCVDVNAELDRRGWARSVPVLVQTAPLAALTQDPPATDQAAVDRATPDQAADLDRNAPAQVVTLARRPGSAWLAAIGEFGTASHESAIAQVSRTGLPSAALAILSGPPQVTFATGYVGATRAALARGVVVGSHLHLGLVMVRPEHRRRGLARQLTRSVARWALSLRAHTAFLQVEEHNTAAVACYAGLGFRTHHTYVTRTQPPATQVQPSASQTAC